MPNRRQQPFQKRKRSLSKLPNKLVLILCEGETEEKYFKEIKSSLPREKQRGIEVDINSPEKYYDPFNLVQTAVGQLIARKKEGIRNTMAWVVFDHDHHPKRAEAFEKAKTAGVKMAYSAICFETWFLLHFNYSTKAFNTGDDLKNQVKKYIKNYEPGKTSMFTLLNEKTNTATENALKLRKAQQKDFPDSPVWELNPYTNVDELVHFLLNL